MMHLKVRGYRTVSVKSFEEASKLYRSYILGGPAKEMIMASMMPAGYITTNGVITHNISYNGNVWDHSNGWKPGDIPVYKPA